MLTLLMLNTMIANARNEFILVKKIVWCGVVSWIKRNSSSDDGKRVCLARVYQIFDQINWTCSGQLDYRRYIVYAVTDIVTTTSSVCLIISVLILNSSIYVREHCSAQQLLLSLFTAQHIWGISIVFICDAFDSLSVLSA